MHKKNTLKQNKRVNDKKNNKKQLAEIKYNRNSKADQRYQGGYKLTQRAILRSHQDDRAINKTTNEL